jgi:putative hydrolase of the HAD superfamily
MALEKTRVDHGDVWMIGDNPINDILGARDTVAAVTLQKMHKGVDLGRDKLAPDASFENFSELRKIIVKLGQSE